MNHPKKTTEAKALVIDTKKHKILYAGAALLAGLLAAALISSNAKAQTEMPKNSIQKSSEEWGPHQQLEEEIRLPFELKSQKLNH